MNQARWFSACEALEFSLPLLLSHQLFQQPFALKLAAETMDKLSRDGLQYDFLCSLIYFNLNAGSFLYPELSSHRRRNHDLAFGCCSGFHYLPPFPTCGTECTANRNVSQWSLSRTSWLKL